MRIKGRRIAPKRVTRRVESPVRWSKDLDTPVTPSTVQSFIVRLKFQHHPREDVKRNFSDYTSYELHVPHFRDRSGLLRESITHPRDNASRVSIENISGIVCVSRQVNRNEDNA